MTNTVDLLEFEEGFRARPYLCSEGYPTVGYGFKLGPKCSPVELKRFYGFELPKLAADAWLIVLIDALTTQLTAHPKIGTAFRSISHDPARKAVLISMAYQMGIDGLAKFQNTLNHIVHRRWMQAHDAMLASKWAKQTPARAKRHAIQMETGDWCALYGERKQA